MNHPKEFAEGLSIGIIMDGNGRWAKQRGLPRTAGHKKGAAVFQDIANYCEELGVSSVTFYAFSTENWKRPLEEVSAIMKLFGEYLLKGFNYKDRNIRIKFLGDRAVVSKVVAGGKLAYGYIDRSGKEGIPCQFDMASGFRFANTWVGMEQDGEYTYTLIGPNGETVLPFRVGDLQDGGKYGHAAASISDATGRKRFGIVANNGKVILPFEYDHIAIFSEWDAANNRWQESAMGTKDGQNFSFDISRRGE